MSAEGDPSGHGERLAAGPTGRLQPHAIRVAGALFLLLALATAWLARAFRVTFPADPVGPRALPLFAASLLALGGVALLSRPGPRSPPSPGDVRLRLALAVAVLAAYPIALPAVGFVATTGAAMSALALLFGGPPMRGIASSFVLAGGLYLLFAYGLGVPLPIGRLFLARGG